MIQLKTDALVKSVELVKNSTHDIVAEMLTKKCEINRKGVFVTSSVLNCANVLTAQRNKLANLAPVTDVAQIAEMAEYKAILAEMQDARLVGVAVIDALKDSALREQQQWVKVRNALEAAFEKAENYASENANFAKRKEQEAHDAKVAGWLSQLHALNDFSKSAKDLAKMADDIFEAYLAMAQINAQRKKEAEEAKLLQAKLAEEARAKELAEAREKQAQAQAEAEKLRKEQAEKDALRATRNATLRPYISFIDYAGDVIDLTAEQFDTHLERAKSSYEEDKKRKDEEAKQLAEAKAEREAQAEKLRKEKAEADALAAASDDEQIGVALKALRAFANNLPSLKSEKGMAKVAAIKAAIFQITN